MRRHFEARTLPIKHVAPSVQSQAKIVADRLAMRRRVRWDPRWWEVKT